MELSTEAGWNQTPSDWSMLLDLAPESCFGLEIDGLLAATTTLVCYGRSLAWLGMVLTRSRYRGRGFAHRLIAHALTVANQRAIRTVKLDATEMGLPLYQKFDFRIEQTIERYVSTVRPQRSPGPSTHLLTLTQIAQLDRATCRAGRSNVLRLLAERSPPASEHGAFVFSRPGLRARFLGPCSASSAESALRLVSQHLSRDDGPWFWDLLPSNPAAASLASEFGFQVNRTLVRMVRGADLVTNAATSFATAGFELG